MKIAFLKFYHENHYMHQNKNMYCSFARLSAFKQLLFLWSLGYFALPNGDFGSSSSLFRAQAGNRFLLVAWLRGRLLTALCCVCHDRLPKEMTKAAT
jgi:hypothetical protein